MELTELGKSLKAGLPAWAWSALQHAKAKFSAWMFPYRIVRHNYGGHPLIVHLKDPMSRRWYDCDWERPKEIEFLLQHRLKPGSKVFDLGAHQSVIAMILASEVGSNGLVIALEPNPFNVRMGQMNIESNGLKNIVLLQAMVSSNSGSGVMSFQLNGRPVSTEPGSWGLEARSITLDELARKYGSPDVIFIDIEGYEFEALKAAREVMAGQVDWCIELHGDEVLSTYGASNALVVKAFLDKSFEVYLSCGGKFNRITSTSMVPDARCHIIAMRPSVGSC